jgi:uncharacterized membrane-anchored protein YitT (DUF2179 family)
MQWFHAQTAYDLHSILVYAISSGVLLGVALGALWKVKQGPPRD